MMRLKAVLIILCTGMMACTSTPEQPLQGVQKGLWVPVEAEAGLITAPAASETDSSQQYYPATYVVGEDPTQIQMVSIFNDPVHSIEEEGYFMGNRRILRQDQYFVVAYPQANGTEHKVAYQHLLGATQGTLEQSTLGNTTWQLQPAIDGVEQLSFEQGKEGTEVLLTRYQKQGTSTDTSNYSPPWATRLERHQDILFIDVDPFDKGLRFVVLEVGAQQLKTVTVHPPYQYKTCTWTKVN